MAENNAAAVQDRRRQPTPEEFIEMQDSAQFKELRSAFRGFTFPVFVVALAWFVFYMIAALFMKDWMATEVLGLNVALWMGMLQFVTTFGITWVYILYANKNFEPRQAAIRETMEG